ncbi:MAG: DUF480 domain-containing protein [Rubricoccaceae bacterium]|nr:DUF480 domain-containing protein [Rubricoccaceae bacterium]
MEQPLSPVAVRVLGALAEKSLATPGQYPLSLNALVGACCQRTGREPVMAVGEGEVLEALEALRRRSLAGTTSGSGSRVERYRHTLPTRYGLGSPGVAAVAALLLRGPQTAGEIRTRSVRLHAFESVGAVWGRGSRP